MTDTEVMVVVMDPETTDSRIQKGSHPHQKVLNFLRIWSFPLILLVVIILGVGCSIYVGVKEERDKFLRKCKKINTTDLWKVNTDPPSYIFGTIPDQPELVWDDDESKVAETTLKQSDKAFTEIVEDAYKLDELVALTEAYNLGEITETDIEKESGLADQVDHLQASKDKLPENVSKKLINVLNVKLEQTGGNKDKEAWNSFYEKVQTNQLALILMRVSPEESFQGKSKKPLESPSNYVDILEKMPEMPDDTVLTLIAWQQQLQCDLFWPTYILVSEDLSQKAKSLVDLIEQIFPED